jgi:hypothetical protein
VPTSLDDEMEPGEISLSLAIEKRELIIRPAWQVGPNEFESAAIRAEDSPLLPEGTSKIPVLAVLEFKEEKAKEDTEEETNDKAEEKTEERTEEKTEVTEVSRFAADRAEHVL